MTRSNLEELFADQLDHAGLPPMTREHKFHPKRRWRFDFAYPTIRLAVEIEGGTWVSGRHNRGSGFEKDCEKYNWAARMGWCVFRFTGKEVKNGTAINWVVAHMDKAGMTDYLFG